MGVSPQANMMAAELVLTSSASLHTCRIKFVTEIIVASCTDGASATRNSRTHKWPLIFSKEDITELWLQVGGDDVEDDSLITPSTDLLLVGRRGKHRGHLLFPSSGLQPPVRLRWKVLQNMKYYFNCVTGCLFTRAGKTHPGEHTVFVRQGESFLQLTFTYSSSTRGQHEVNVTTDDLGPPRDLKNLTLVWVGHAGTVGVLVDGVPVANISGYSPLSEAGVVEAEVTEGHGFISTCDLRYQGVAGPTCAGGRAGGPHYDDLNATSTLAVPGDAASLPDAPGSSTGAIQVISALLAVTLVCLFTTIVLALLHYHTNKKLQCLQKATGATSSSAANSTRNSSVRSSHRRKEPVPLQDNEDTTSLSEATLALSETVMTPAPTPGSLSETRSPKFVSTKDFVDLDLN